MSKKKLSVLIFIIVLLLTYFTTACSRNFKSSESSLQQELQTVEENKTVNYQQEIEYIECVRGATLYDYPNVTVGYAFDNYFGESDWYEFYDDYGNHLIEVTGIGYEKGNRVFINVQLILYDNGEFEWWALWVNDDLRSDSDLQSFIEAVFNPK